LAVRVLKLSKFGGDLTKFRQKQVKTFLGPPCRTYLRLVPTYYAVVPLTHHIVLTHSCKLVSFFYIYSNNSEQKQTYTVTLPVLVDFVRQLNGFRSCAL